MLIGSITSTYKHVVSLALTYVEHQHIMIEDASTQ